MELQLALKAAQEAADLGRKVLLDYYGDLKNVQEKEMAGLVSEADVESEKVITEHLLKYFPKSAILGEEQAFATQEVLQAKSHSEGQWIIDPLDGTTNYIHQIPIYCVSIGLEVDGECVLGVIDVPSLGDRYHAVKGQGAFKNGQPIRVSQREKLEEALLATGFFPPNKEALKEQLDVFVSLIPQIRGIRRMGAAAYDLCMVAEGVFDAYWEKNLSPWDTAAGFVIVQEACGIVTTYDSNTYSPFDKSIIAGSPILHKVVKEHIHRSKTKNQSS